MDQKRRIGIYGGTFDPVHVGHLEIAKRAVELFEFDEVVFVPALVAPHKLKRAVTSHLHRYAMLALATNDDTSLVVSTFELEAPDRRYTVDTVAHFQAQFAEAELFFIMGADSWAEITTWREWEGLLSMVNHLVVTRPGVELPIIDLPGDVNTRIVDLRGSNEKRTKSPVGTGTIFISDVVMIDISATEIRRAIRANRLTELKEWVPDPVVRYIEKYDLYRDFE